MPAYCVGDIVRVKDAAKMADYRSRVGAVVERFGGKYLVAGGMFEVLEGKWRPTFPVILEFPSLEQARRFYDSPEYCDLKALRKSATDSDFVLIEGI